ncbi:hypothetical protein AgCh_013212 [Apium graveolens]
MEKEGSCVYGFFGEAVKVCIGEINIYRVFIDNRISVNILYYDVYKKMGFLDKDIEIESIYIYNFGEEAMKVNGMETIEVINEGTEEVRENKLEILTFEYEHFKSNPGEGITEVFGRYNALINNLNINGKYYSIREVNKKFLLTLPTHLKHRITAIREVRDLNEISLERLYGMLKTYELEQIQQKEVYGKGRVVSTSTALVVEEPQQQQQSQQLERMVQSSKAEENVIVAEFDPPTTNQSKYEFYSLEELEQLEDESMALIVKRFSNVRFKRNPKFKYKSNYNRFQKGGSSSSNTSSGGYKIGMVDRSTI